MKRDGACPANDAGARDATRENFLKLPSQMFRQNHHSQSLSHSASSASAVSSTLPHILLIDTFTFKRKLTKVPENQQLARCLMIHFSSMTLL